jgi:osmoprotectant transport system permease protein
MTDDLIRWDWIGDHVDLFAQDLGDHIYMALLPSLFGLLVAVPVGLACARWPRFYPPVLATTSILYALPSLALFALLIDFTGLTATTVVIPLTIYSLSVLIRNVVDGLRSVPPSTVDAATAMGYSGLRRLLAVELPIALPVVMAGLRVATVSNISLVSIGSLIGVGGLGQLFIDGFQRDFPTPIIVGVVLTIALAVLADAVLVVAQRLLTPWYFAERGKR